MKNLGGHGLRSSIYIYDIDPVTRKRIFPKRGLRDCRSHARTVRKLLDRSTFTVEVKDTATGEIESSVTRPMRSFTANFLRLIWGRMTGQSATGGLDINDTAIDESSGKATNLKCAGATTGLKKFGICIGTGTGTVAQTDNKLTWDTGFSTYGATTLKTATTISGSDIYFEIQKAFVNSTGSSRTVEEVGLCTTGEGTEADNNSNVLIARELTGGTAVANGKTLTVSFKISSTFTTGGVINRTFMEQLQQGFCQRTTWDTATTSGAFGLVRGCQILNYNNKMYMICGWLAGAVSNQVYSSIDGITWTQVRADGEANGFTKGAAFACTVYDGKMWVIGGYTAGGYVNSVFYSTDGQTWTSARADGAANGFEKCQGLCCWNFLGRMYIACGYGAATYNSVYYSTNGTTWTQVRADGAANGFTKSGFCGSFVYDNKLWLAGGYAVSCIDDIYSSPDGQTWTLENGTAEFGVRAFQTISMLGNVQYLVAGADNSVAKKDLWYSVNGKNWTQITADCGFAVVNGHAATIKDHKLFIAGGWPNGGTCVDDCFYYILPIFDKDTGAPMDTFARIDSASGAVYGITAGTGTMDFTGADTALVTPIADGSGGGQLDYGNMQDAGRLNEPYVSGSDNIMRLERDFTNNSGGSITLKEIGLSALGLDSLGLLLMRGLVDKTVADGAAVRVAIELETTV